MTGALRPGPRGWRGIALVVPFLVLLIAGVLYTNHVQRQSDRQWCELLVTLDEAYQAGPPPETEIGRRVLAAVHNLREDFDCEGERS